MLDEMHMELDKQPDVYPQHKPISVKW